MDEHKGQREDLVITRVFDAPREMVWRAYTDPDQVKRWWGPAGFTAPVVQIDLREGGRYLYDMRSPEGQDFWSAGVYEEVVEGERIVATDSFSDEHGNPVPASYYGLGDDFPAQMKATVEFEDEDGKTRMTITQEGMPAGEVMESATEGWNQSLDKLEETLRSDMERAA